MSAVRLHLVAKFPNWWCLYPTP